MEKILGQALKNEREMRGISLADIAAETRIGTRFLEAMENEQFDMFPGTFYIHYYIKNYLKACGADDTAFFNTYGDYLKNILKKGVELPPEQYLNKMSYVKIRQSKKILVAGTLLAILGAIFYFFLGPPRLADRVFSGWEAAAFDFPAIANDLLLPGEDFCLAAPPVNARMTFTAPCWLQLWRGGEKVAEKTFRPGETFSLSGYQLTMIVANPAGLRLTLNGREVSYFRSSPIAVKLVVNPENLDEILRR
jgi:hypothetical protein